MKKKINYLNTRKLFILDNVDTWGLNKRLYSMLAVNSAWKWKKINFLHIFQILGISLRHPPSAFKPGQRDKMSFSQMMMYYLRMAHFKTCAFRLGHLIMMVLYFFIHIFQLAPEITVLPENYYFYNF